MEDRLIEELEILHADAEAQPDSDSGILFHMYINIASGFLDVNSRDINEPHNTALMLGAKLGYIELVIDLGYTFNANPGLRNYENDTALMLACRNNNAEMVQVLCNLGVSYENARDSLRIINNSFDEATQESRESIRDAMRYMGPRERIR